MLTPVDVQNKVFKGGIGFDKKDVESFMRDLSSDYEMLYRSNVELKDKVNTLNESLQHYRSIEESMQKALTISEKTAEETVNEANEKARQLKVEAEKKAETMLADAKEELAATKNEIYQLQQQYEQFKEQFTNILQSQLALINGEMVKIDLGADFEGTTSANESDFGLFSNNGVSSTLNGGLGGGYVGNNSSFGDGFERSNQEPALNRGSLNMDPFASAANGNGDRFSNQTGKTFKNSKPATESTVASKIENTNKKQEKSDTLVKPTKDVKPEIIENTKPVNSVQDEKETSNVSGEVEDKVRKSSLIDNEDNLDEGLQFLDEEDTINTTENSDNETVSGEVEDKVNNTNILDSEDNYDTGLEFLDDEAETNDNDDVTYSGEVEDRVSDTRMLDSEDNYDEGIEFLVGNEDAQDEIPTISK